MLDGVRTRFVSNHNRVGFARKKAHTISFVERGFEKAGSWSLGGGLVRIFVKAHTKVDLACITKFYKDVV